MFLCSGALEILPFADRINVKIGPVKELGQINFALWHYLEVAFPLDSARSGTASRGERIQQLPSCKDVSRRLGVPYNP